MRLRNGIQIGNRPVIGVDWSRTGVEVYDPRVGESVKFLNLEEVAQAHPGCFLVLETTAESYELQRRATVLQAFETHDIIAYGYKTQRTAWFRKQFLIEKSNKADAQVIYRIATETTLSLHRFELLPEGDPTRQAIKKFLVHDRYMHNGEESEQLSEKYLDGVSIPDEFKELIFAGKKYRKQVGRILAVAVEVRKANRGYREFRRQLGNYGNGYASMPRSEFYHWWTRMVTNARLGRHVAKALNVLTDDQRKVHRQVLKDATAVAKYLWRLTS